MPTALADRPAWGADALSMFQRLLPADFLKQVQADSGIRQNNRVYGFLVVMWLMVAQRLAGGTSLECAVLELLRGLPVSFWPRPCKRLQRWQKGEAPLSSHTGAYNKARQRLPLQVIEKSCDQIFEQLTARTDGILPALGRRAFFFDGTSVRLAHSEALCKSYPPGSNRHGESHWPLLRMLVAHDLRTGLAMRPQWGAMHGDNAVGEQQLLEAAMSQLPSGSAIVGDANFGVFSVAHAAVENGHPVLLRLTIQRAQRLAGAPLQDGMDRRIVWHPSRDDRKSHPDLPDDACVQGRLVTFQVQPSNGGASFLLAVFTTLDIGEDEVLKLYGQRWNIETDLRTLKSTLQLEQLDCTTPDMVAKELDMAVAAYNLVRAITCLASQQSDTPPRGYSFTRVRNVIHAFAPLVAAAQSPDEAQQHFDRMMYYVRQAKLPHRARKRNSYPRAVWHRGGSFPNRKT